MSTPSRCSCHPLTGKMADVAMHCGILEAPLLVAAAAASNRKPRNAASSWKLSREFSRTHLRTSRTQFGIKMSLPGQFTLKKFSFYSRTPSEIDSHEQGQQNICIKATTTNSQQPKETIGTEMRCSSRIQAPLLKWCFNELFRC